MIIDKSSNTTSRIWAVFSDNTGVISDVGTASLIIYPANSNTPQVSSTEMTRLGTGIYYYPFDVTSINAGAYNVNFNFWQTGTYFNNNLAININTGLTSGDFNKAFATTSRLWANFGTTSGEVKDAGTVSVSVYPANNSTPYVSSAVMTRLGTGLYYYPLNYGTFANGNYTAIFTALNGTNNYSGLFDFVVQTGTVSTVAPSAVGTISFENGTSGTHGFLKWTPLPSGVDGYDIYRASRPFSTFTKIASTAGGTYQDNDVYSQSSYWYYVVGTSSSGASLPSPIKNAFVYDSEYNHLSDCMEQIKTNLQNEFSWIKAVYLGEPLVYPAQLPIVAIIPDTDIEDASTVGKSGKYNKTFNLKLKVYDALSGQGLGTELSILTEYVGKIKMQLESLKSYDPYWYLSQIGETNYANAVIEEQTLRTATIDFSPQRRLIRPYE